MTRVAIVAMLMAVLACGDDASGEADAWLSMIDECKSWLTTRPASPTGAACHYDSDDDGSIDQACEPGQFAPDGSLGCVHFWFENGCTVEACDPTRCAWIPCAE